MILPLPHDLARLLRELPILRHAYLVGGCVRDAILGHPLKDFDVEVFGATYEALADALRPWGRPNFVGRSFGVIKLSLGHAVHDFSIPRRDSKIAPGHRGFEVRLDPHITPREAAARRDFTLNALMVNPRSGELLDFFGGREDLERRRLRHVGDAFSEDPLRVLRGMQLAGRFNLSGAPETLACCRELRGAFHELPFERVREEWFKWAARSLRPSAGLRWLEATGWLAHFPELDALRGVPQEPDWHPEGDVFQHTCHALDALPDLPAWREADETTRIVISLAVLTHDLGKATRTRTVLRDGRPRITSPGHETDSATLAASFLDRLRVPRTLTERVTPLVLHHMTHFNEPGERPVRRLARRLAPETVEHLCLVMTADAHGRPPRPRHVPPGVEAIRRIADQLDLARSAPTPVLLGRHLLALGLPPGPALGRWTRAAFEAQLDGHFHDLPGAHAWLAQQPEFPPDAAALAARAGPG